MNFFGHDSNASNDPRIKKLMARYGFAGSGLYWHMVELITRHLDPPREQSCELQEDPETLSYSGRMEIKLCEEIIQFMVEVGLFERTKSKKLRNCKVLRRLSDAQKRKIRRTETDNGRTEDGQQTDSDRGEVNRSEGEVKGSEKNRSEGKAKPQDGSNQIPKDIQRRLDKIAEYHQMLQNPKYGSDQQAEFKLGIKMLESQIDDINNRNGHNKPPIDLDF